MPSTHAMPGFIPVHSTSGKAIQLTMQKLHLTGRILPVGARLLVSHIFRSSESRPVEVIYTFGLPRDASVRRFRITGEGFSVRSELKPTKKAREVYEQGLERGSLSALVESYRDGLVCLNVGNIRPEEEVKVTVEVLCGVDLRDDGLRLRFPFTLAPGYHRQARMATVNEGVGEIELPEEEFGDLILPQFSSDASALHEVGFDLNATMPQAIAEVASPSHGIRVRPKTASSFRVTSAGGGELPNRDLVLDAKAVNGIDGVLSGSDCQGQGRFAVVFSSRRFGKAASAPRRIIFTLDRSASMSGRAMAQARGAIKACLGVLTDEDQFGIVAFDNDTETFQPEMTLGSRFSTLFGKSGEGRNGALFPATTELRRQAGRFLDKIDARGGTELAAALGKASEILGAADGEIVVITDGQVFGTEDIIGRARDTGTRFHCLGIGEASQDRLLTLLARETGGVSRFVTPLERVDREALELFDAVAKPVARNLAVEPRGLTDAKLNVLPPTTVFEGMASTAMGEASANASGDLELRWEIDGRPDARKIPIEIGQSVHGETIRLLEGARLITDLEARNGPREGGAAAERARNDRLRRRLQTLSTEYGLASREMSLVAVVERSGDRPGETPETRVVAVGLPGDTYFDSYFGIGTGGMIPCLQAGDTGQFAAMPTMAMRPRSSRPFLREILIPPTGRERSVTDNDPFARLVQLLAGMEPDGGMPGRGLEDRLRRSAHALLSLLENGHSPSAGALRSHASRLVQFLESHQDRHAEISELVKIAKDGTSLPGAWLDVKPGSDVWPQIYAALQHLSERAAKAGFKR